MSDLDEKKPPGKAGKRKRNADQRSRKPDAKPLAKADQPRADAAPIAPVLSVAAATVPSPAKTAKTPPIPVIAAVEPVPVALQANKLQTETAILTAAAIPVAAQDVGLPPAVPMASASAPVTAPNLRQTPAAPTASVDMAPIAGPKPKEPAVTSSATPTSAKAAPSVPAADASVSLQTIANAYGEYTRKSLEQTKCFFDKLKEVRSLEQAVEIQTEFAKQACETFVAEAQRINDLHRELARQRLERLEGLMAMGTQTSH